MARPSGRDIRSEAIDTATRAIQARGATGFSFASIAEELGVRAPSIHHHFPRKADLLAAVATQYRHQFRARVEALDAEDTRRRLEAYADLFLEPAERALMCLCGAAAGSWSSLDPVTRREVQAFFTAEIAWVTGQVADAITTGEFIADLHPESFAKAFIATLEGALLLDRAIDEPDVIPAASTVLLDLASRCGP